MLRALSVSLFYSAQLSSHVNRELLYNISKRTLIHCKYLQRQFDRPPHFSLSKAVNEEFDTFINADPKFEDFHQFVQSVKSLPSHQDKALDTILMKRCLYLGKFSVGDSFLEYLYKIGKKPNLATLSRYLELCYKFPKEASLSKVEEICNAIRVQYQYLDLSTTESLVLGLSLTKSWKVGLNYLKKAELLGVPGSLSMSAVAKAAILHNEYDFALEILDQIINNQRLPHEFAYVTWIENADLEKLFSLLKFWGANEIFPSVAIVDKLRDQFTKYGWDMTETKISQKGFCAHCYERLKSTALTDEQYQQLRENFLKRVLTGSDVFIGSNPEEVSRFRAFVESKAPFDIVIDGLNVAYKRNVPNVKNKLQTLKSVVDHFSQLRKKILVLGKVHLKNWSTPLMNDITSKASVFLTDNLSRDDPFMIYAALYSGPGSQILSHDLMRDHAFRLRDPALAALFRQWRRSCQLDIISITKSGRVVMQLPLKHLTAAQKSSETCWHIPYDDGSPRYTHELPTTWLCVQERSKVEENLILTEK